jgi:predicted RNA-binding protein associated with RNAse of E/G family
MEKLLQGSLFIAAATGGGVAKFNNKMRLVGQNSNFYKMNNSYKRNEVTVVEKHRAWLNIYNAEGVFKQILDIWTGQLTRTMLLDGTSFNSNQYLDFIVFVKVKIW